MVLNLYTTMIHLIIFYIWFILFYFSLNSFIYFFSPSFLFFTDFSYIIWMFICVFFFFLPSSQLNLTKLKFQFSLSHLICFIFFFFFSSSLKRGFRNQIHYPHFGQDSTPVAPGAYPKKIFPFIPPIYI